MVQLYNPFNIKAKRVIYKRIGESLFFFQQILQIIFNRINNGLRNIHKVSTGWFGRMKIYLKLKLEIKINKKGFNYLSSIGQISNR